MWLQNESKEGMLEEGNECSKQDDHETIVKKGIRKLGLRNQEKGIRKLVLRKIQMLFQYNIANKLLVIKDRYQTCYEPLAMMKPLPGTCGPTTPPTQQST